MSSTKESDWPRNPAKLLESYSTRQMSIPTAHLTSSERRALASILLKYGFRPKTVRAFTNLSPKIVSTLRKKVPAAKSPFSHSGERSRCSYRHVRHSDHDYLLWRYFHWAGPWLPFLSAMRIETGIRIDELLAFYMFMVNRVKRYDLRRCPACSHQAPLRPRDHGCPACLKSGRAAHKHKRKQTIGSSPYFR